MRRLSVTRKIMRLGIVCVTVLALAGCGRQELAQSDIEATDTYKELQMQYNKLERQYNKLKASETTAQATSGDASVSFTKILNSTYIKVRYTNNANGSYEISDNASLCVWLKKQLGKAIADTNQNAQSWQEKHEALYSYTLYNEDNSVCQCQVYADDYVIFTDYPNVVYYAAGVCRLGDAVFSDSTTARSPKRSVFSNLYESQMAFRDNKLLSVAATKAIASAFAYIPPQHLGAKPSDVEVGSQHELIFKCSGVTYVMEVYTNYVSITTDGTTVDWYRADADQLKAFVKADETEE